MSSSAKKPSQQELRDITEQLRSLPLTMDFDLSSSVSPYASVSFNPASSGIDKDTDLRDTSFDAAAVRSSDSKAVLAALRALQSKIHRLESEKLCLRSEAEKVQTYHANQIAEHCSNTAKLMELNSASVKERDELRSRLSSLQHEFDSLRAEMEHLRESFKKSQSDRSALQQTLLQSKEATVKEQWELQRRLRDAEWRLGDMEREHREKLNETQSALRFAEEQFRKEKAVRQSADRGRVKMEEYLNSVLAINDQLVQKFSLKAQKAPKKLTKQVSKKTTKRSHATESLHHQVQDAYGQPLPFITSSSGGGDTHSLPATVQEVLSQHPHKSALPQNSAETGIFNPYIVTPHMPAPASTSSKPVDHTAAPITRPSSSSTGSGVGLSAGSSAVAAGAAAKNQRVFASPPRSRSRSGGAQMDGPPVTQAHAHVHPHAHVASTETMASIASVIRSLEEELDRLNRDYRSSLDMIRDSHGSSESTAHHNRISDMIEQMQRKSQQLFTLKNYADDVKSGKLFLSSINTLNTPEARRSYEKKIKSLRVLGEFRSLMDR